MYVVRRKIKEAVKIETSDGTIYVELSDITSPTRAVLNIALPDSVTVSRHKFVTPEDVKNVSNVTTNRIDRGRPTECVPGGQDN